MWEHEGCESVFCKPLLPVEAVITRLRSSGVRALGFRLQDFWGRVWALGLKAQGSGFRGL